MKLSVIMPIYSEMESVKSIVEEIKEILGEKLYEIIFIVAPKSTPESIEFCRNLSYNEPKIRFYLQKNNPGVGRAYREGFEYASGDYTLLLDADGQNDLATIDLMIKKIEKDGLDLAVASRWIEGGGINIETYGMRKFIFNRIFNFIIRILYGTSIHDLTFSYKLIKTSLLKNIKWEGVGFELNAETTLKPIKYGFKVGEVPSKTNDRKEGKSKYSLMAALRYIPVSFKILLHK